MTNDEHSHKGMGGELITPEQWDAQLAKDGLYFDGSAQTEGGLIYSQADDLPTGWVKPPVFRVDPDHLRTKDVRSVITEDRPDPLNTTPLDLKSGAELELYGYNPQTKDLARIMSDEAQQKLDEVVPVHSKDLFGEEDYSRWHCSAELAQACIEVNFPEGPCRLQNARSMVEHLQLVNRVVETAVPGAMILPVSTLPHRELTKDDVTSDPYVRRMAFDVMGWEMSQHFTGASVQGHTESLTRKGLLAAANEYQHVSALLMGFTLAAPFTHGELSGLSGRYLTRVNGSPPAGIYNNPLPTTEKGYYEIVQSKLQAGVTPSAARGAGEHCDRPRVDIPKYGTFESCEGDTAGASPHKLVALQYAKDVLLWKLQRQHIMRDYSHWERYPKLFTKPSNETYELAHDASLMVAAQGLGAMIHGQDKRQYRGTALLAELMRYIDEPVMGEDGQQLYGGLPRRVKRELQLSAQKPNGQQLSTYLSEGVTSTRGYYESGVGTLAHWELARYWALRREGVAHMGALHNTLQDVAESWRGHIRQLRPAGVAAIVHNEVELIA